MRRIIFAIFVACAVCYCLEAKSPLGKVTVSLNDGSIVNGYCEDMFKHERPSIKVSPLPDGKKSVKYHASDIRELKYEIPNDTIVEHWYPIPYYHTKTLMMKKVRQCGTVTLWSACIGLQELTGPQGMKWTERVRDCISFGPDMAGNTAWDFSHIIHGRCKELPGYGDFIKEYKKSHQEVTDWTEIEPLMDMCRAYVDFIKPL
ncbi:MAG: hypothetical protein K2O30_11060 [Duncaniella sp.]|nr:hypothetical protein [Duncaniella sp.]MDE7146667.1 hypothetical protein [Duncaniella sp.]